MSERIRTHDWPATPLGPIEEWPQCLRSAVDIGLDCGFPCFLWWGPELVQIYNDAATGILRAKHPGSLGRPAREVWADVWTTVGPLFQQVLATGAPFTAEDMPLVPDRGGPREEALFTFSYSVLREADGGVAGMMAVAIESTAKVRAIAAHERKRADAALRESEERYRLIMEAARDYAILTMDPEGTIQSWSPGAEAVFGWTAEEVIGRPVATFFTPEDRAAGRPETEQRIAREQGVAPDVRWHQRKDGTRVFIDGVVRLLRGADGKERGFLKIGQDMTEWQKAQQERERLLASERAARAEAEAANQAKADFLASMSHELRTPLNAIGGYVDLLDLGVHGPLTDAQRQALSRVTANQRHLLTLINDVLAFAKLEAGQVEFDVRPLAACDLLAGVEPLVGPLAQAKGIALSVGECDADLRLVADEERVRQILLNLVGNAVKFIPEGGWVLMSCEARAEWTEIHVRDNGPGISAVKQQMIFDPFVQVDRRLNQPHEGVGLGLAISRDLARAMSGELSVTSMEGEGSTFTLRLPRRVEAAS